MWLDLHDVAERNSRCLSTSGGWRSNSMWWLVATQ